MLQLLPLEGPWRHRLDFAIGIFEVKEFPSLDLWRTTLLRASDDLMGVHDALGCFSSFVLAAPSCISSLQLSLAQSMKIGQISTEKMKQESLHGIGLIGTNPVDNTSSFSTNTAFPDVPGLLPISPVALEEFVSTKCLSLMSSRWCSQSFAELCGNWCKLMINALNFSACAARNHLSVFHRFQFPRKPKPVRWNIVSVRPSTS